MGSMRNWMLGAAMLAGIAGLGAGTAQAAEVRVIVRGPVAYAPHYAGPGHVLAAGYRVNGRWNRGYRSFRGPPFGVMCALVADGFTDVDSMADAEGSAGRLGFWRILRGGVLSVSAIPGPSAAADEGPGAPKFMWVSQC